MNILFVCTGNTCRSAMAEAVMKKTCAESHPDVFVSSAGICASSGSPASPDAVKACREISVDLTEHRSRMVTPEILDENDIIVPMARSHAEFLAEHGVKAEKIFFLPPGIPDPYMGGIEIYRECLKNIVLLCKTLEKNL